MIKPFVRKSGRLSRNQDAFLEFIFENSDSDFSLREIEKEINIPKSTAYTYLKNLKDSNLLDKNSIFFKINKINFFVEKIVSSGLIDFLIDELNPSCIIVFGSVRKGDYDRNSDIDLFIESSIKKNLDLSKFEKKLKHKVELFVESNINKLPDNLFNNVVNGIKLYGSFKIK